MLLPTTISSQKQKGFTIVELLIVIVVIGILAAITIVAFNGVQNRAKTAAAQSTAAQSSKKVQLFAVQNSDTYPVAAGTNGLDNLTDLGIANTGGTTYQYSANNDSSPRTFCLTSTTGGKSYYQSNTVTIPTLGACNGHDINGIPAITNLLPNSSVENDTTNLQSIGNATGRVIARTAVTGAKDGSYVLRIAAGSTGALAGYGSVSETLTVGKRYVGSLWFRASAPLTVAPYFEGSATRTNVVAGSSVTVAAGQWARLSRTVEITAAGTLKVGFLSSSTVAQGDYIEVDGFSLIEGETQYNFANGDTERWVWNGVRGSSTSTGPGIPL